MTSTHLLLPHFLTAIECSCINEQFDAIGWAPAPVRLASGAQAIPGLRNSERVEITQPQWAEEFWNRLMGLPEASELQNLCPGQAVSMRSWFRGYRYLPDQRFGKHRDGQEIEGQLISRVTALFYLNDTLEGEGATILYPKKGEKGLRVEPAQGSLLLFPSTMLHEGEAPTLGIKLVLRSDLLFNP